MQKIRIGIGIKRIIMKFIKLCVFFSLFTSPIVNAKSAVSYHFSGGRLGDNLLSYSHARWIAYRYNMPFFYRPFEYSDQFMMHIKETHLTNDIVSTFDQVVNVNLDNVGEIDPEKNILYIIPFFSESIRERTNPRCPFLFSVDWEDQCFKNLLQEMISPNCIIEPSCKRDDCLSVALHIRVGTGFDIKGLDDYWWIMTQSWVELKFPPFSFYLRALELLYNLHPEKKLYVYLFTDHTDAHELAQIFIEKFKGKNIIFDYRRTENRHDLNVISDFFELTSFDCLIRSDSNFAMMASKVSTYVMQISPWHIDHSTDIAFVDEVCIDNNIIKW